jgi:hypothetical protein
MGTDTGITENKLIDMIRQNEKDLNSNSQMRKKNVLSISAK